MSYILSLQCEKTERKSIYSILIFLLLIADLTICINLPLFRQILSGFFLLIFPGLIILDILDLFWIDKIKLIALSVPISLSFLMSYGFFVNFSLSKLGMMTPLSTLTLLVSFNFAIIFLIFFAYFKKKNQSSESKSMFISSSIRINFMKLFGNNNKLFISPVIFSFLIPFLSVFGIFLMNRSGNNTVLLILLFIILIYIILIVFLKSHVYSFTYPVSLLMISISLVLMHGLNTNYLNGIDVYEEYATSQSIINNQYCNFSNCPNILFSTLSVSLLPVIFQSFLGIENLLIFKIVYPLIFAFIPLICFFLFKLHLDELSSFFSSFFFISQVAFLATLQSALREGIGLLMFASVVLVLFDGDFVKSKKMLLFILFTLSTVVAHYTTAYIMFYYLLGYYIITNIFKVSKYLDSNKSITASIVLLIFCFLFLWYAMITNTMDNHIHFIWDVQNRMSNILVEDVERSQAHSLVIDTDASNIQKIRSTINNFSFIFIALGVFSWSFASLKKFRQNNHVLLNGEFIIMMYLSALLLVSLFIVPKLNVYGSGRFYQQTLVFLSPALVIGSHSLMHKFHYNHKQFLALFIIILCFFNATYLTDFLLGENTSPNLNRNGYRYGIFNINEEEVFAGEWLRNSIKSGDLVYTDKFGPISLCFGQTRPQFIIKRNLFFSNSPLSVNNCFIYLRKINLIDNIAYNEDKYVPISEYSYLFIDKNKIFNNGGAEIWK